MSKSTCSVESCDRPVIARGYCRAHYSRWQRTGDPVGSGKPIGPPRGRRRVEAPCSVDGCERSMRTRGYCSLHYNRLLETGEPGPATLLPHGAEPKDPTERFFAKVNKTETCWLWTGGRMRNGYGYSFYVSSDRRTLPHRFSYELVNGPIPDGMEVDHMCHVPLCVNPAHLQAVSRTLNNENRAGANKNSATGIRGVSFDRSRGRYEAHATHGRRKYLAGRFDTIKEAEAAATALRLRLHKNNLQDRAAS